MRNIKRRAIVLAAATSGLLPVISAKAANATWNASPASALWNAANWSSGANSAYTPVAGTDALFFGTSNTTTLNNDFAADSTFVGLTFNAGASAFTLNGNGITATGNVVNSSGVAQTIGLGIKAGNGRTIDGGTGGLNLTGVLTNTSTGANATITLAGTGTIGNGGFTSTGVGSNTMAMTAATTNWTIVDTTGNSSLLNVGSIGGSRGTGITLNMSGGSVLNYGTVTSAPNTNWYAGGTTAADLDHTVGNTTAATLNVVNGVLTFSTRLNTRVSTINVNNSSTLNIWNQFQGSNSTLGELSTVNVGNNANFVVSTSGGATVGGGTLYLASRGTGVLNITGNGLVNAGMLDVSRNITNGTKGTVNLDGGTLMVNNISTSTANSVAANTLSSGTFNFNGGTLKAKQASATFITHNSQNNANDTPLNLFVKAGGAIIDSNTFDITSTLPLLHDTSVTTDGGLTKNSAGNLTLAGDNTFNGPTNVNGGALTIGGGTTSGGFASSVATLAAGTTLNFNKNAPLSVVANIGGGGAVNQNGTGITTMSGTSTYSGDTTVSAGGLVVNGSLNGAGNVIVNNATLGGSGTIGVTTVNGNSSIRPGASAADGFVGTLHTGNLTINGGDIRMDAGDLISVAGAATFGGATTVTLTVPPGAGNYVLLSAASPITYGSTPTLNSPTGTRLTFALDTATDTSKLGLNVSGSVANLIWAGTAGNAWDVNNTVNWTGADGKFFNLDNVTFDDSAANKTVQLDATVQPTSVTVNNSVGNDYTIQGGGNISGVTSLVKTGTGKLILGLNNSYTGGTNIQNGTIQLSSGSAIPANSTVTLGSGTNSGVLDLGGQSLALGSIVASGTGTGNVITTSGGDGNLTIAATGTDTFTGKIQDTGGPRVNLTVSTGTLALTQNNTYTGSTNINSGAALVVGTGGTSGSVPFANMNNNGTLVINRSDTVVVTDNINGSGATVNQTGTLQVGNGAGNGQLASGPIVNNGTLVFNRGTDNITLNNTNAISGSGVLRKQGVGAASFTAASSYTGNTIIEAGRIFPVVSGALGAANGGSVSVANGAGIDVGVGGTANALNFGLKPFFVEGAGPDGVGVIVNTASVAQQNAFQVVTLTGDATFSNLQSTSRFDIRSGGGQSVLGGTLTLNNHTLTKNGPGQMSIVAIDITDGTIVANAGTLGIEGASVLKDFGTGNKVIINSITGAAAPTVLGFFQNSGTFTRPVDFNTNGGSINITNANAASVTIGSNATLNGGVAFIGNNVLTWTGNFVDGANPGNITKNGTNTLTLTGTNTYTGGSTIGGGTLQIGNGGATGSVGAGPIVNNGSLAFNRTGTLAVGGAISGGGPVYQNGTGTTQLSGNNSYSGVTTVRAGKLVLANNAKNPVLTGGGADVQGGRLILDYNDTGVAPDVKTILTTGFGQTPKFSSGAIRTSNAADPTKGLGWKDDSVAKQETVAYTYYGDANLDGQVDVTDLGALATNWQTNNVWAGGDFNYDGFVDVTDLGSLATNWQLGVGNPLGPGSLESAMASVGLGNVSVPEPTSFGVLGLCVAAAASRRRTRKAR